MADAGYDHGQHVAAGRHQELLDPRLVRSSCIDERRHVTCLVSRDIPQLVARRSQHQNRVRIVAVVWLSLQNNRFVFNETFAGFAFNDDSWAPIR